MGGPIRKNKTFFFGSYQFNRIDFNPLIRHSVRPGTYGNGAHRGVSLLHSGFDQPFGREWHHDYPKQRVAGKSCQCGVPIVPNCGGAITVRCIASYDTRAAANNTAGRPLDSVVAGILNPYPLPNAFTSGDGLNTGAFL